MGGRRIIITRVVVFLLLGAIVNVAVAWGAAVWIDVPAFSAGPFFFRGTGDVTTAEGEGWEFLRYDAFASTIVSATVLRHRIPLQPVADADVAAIQDYVRQYERFERGEPWPRDPRMPIIAAPNWSQAHTPPPISHERVSFIEDARGWPVRTLLSSEVFISERLQPRNRRSTVHGAIDLHDVQGPRKFARRLPLKPIWPGFTINTVFYAGILWVLFAAPFALRSRIRIRRGLCPACAYPVGDSAVCTECGEAVTPRRGDGM